MAQNNPLVTWLDNAYAMEQSIAEVLEKQVGDTKNHPTIQAKIQEHLDKTKHHAELDKQCIKRLGGDTSSLKSGMANIMGNVQGMMSGMGEDKLVKAAVFDYGVEHFEIATYRAIMTAAQETSDQQTARVCQEILNDEEEMAQWLGQHLPGVVREVFHKMAPPQQTSESAGASANG